MVEDTPQPARNGPLAWATRLPGRAFAALLAGPGRLRPAPGADDHDLWLLVLASDPDGVWYPWPGDDGRPRFDDAAD